MGPVVIGFTCDVVVISCGDMEGTEGENPDDTSVPIDISPEKMLAGACPIDGLCGGFAEPLLDRLDSSRRLRPVFVCRTGGEGVAMAPPFAPGADRFLLGFDGRVLAFFSSSGSPSNRIYDGQL